MREYPQEPRGKAALTGERLRDLARAYGAGAKLPTMRRLSEELDTPPATLKRALTNLEAEGVLRRREGSRGIFVSDTLNRRRVALVCDPSFFGGAGLSPFWGMLIERIQERAAASQDEEISLHFTRPLAAGGAPAAPRDRGRLPLHEDLTTAVCQGRVHGVLGIGLPESVAHWLEMSGLPLVSFAGAGRTSVGVDYAAMIDVLTDALVRQGCRHIEMWCPAYRTPAAEQAARDISNRDAFARALTGAGLPFDASQYRRCRHLIRRSGGGSLHAMPYGEQGYETALSVFGPGTPPGARPDGVVVLDDMMTLGALGALQALNLRAGRDVRIATHANAGSPALVGWESFLTVAEVDPARIVDEMFRLLGGQMERETAGGACVLVPPSLHLPTAAG